MFLIHRATKTRRMTAVKLYLNTPSTSKLHHSSIWDIIIREHTVIHSFTHYPDGPQVGFSYLKPAMSSSGVHQSRFIFQIVWTSEQFLPTLRETKETKVRQLPPCKTFNCQTLIGTTSLTVKSFTLRLCSETLLSWAYRCQTIAQQKWNSFVNTRGRTDSTEVNLTQATSQCGMSCLWVSVVQFMISRAWYFLFSWCYSVYVYLTVW